MMNISLRKVEKAIGIPAKKWNGRCHEIAGLMLDRKLVEGKLRYGHWIGPISPKSIFANYPQGLIRHGWIELKDGRVVDPSRFGFENKEPYIYIGPNDHYDAGGNKFRLNNMKPAPNYSGAEKKITLSLKGYLARALVQEMLGLTGKGSKISITMRQAFWLANLPLQTFNGLAKPVYEALIEANLGALIPYDNREMAMNG